MVFESWLTTLTLVRNSCCHHSRVWNKVNFILPMMPRRISHPWITLPVDPHRTYFNICVIKYFLGVISPNNDMLAKLRRLFVDFPKLILLQWDSRKVGKWNRSGSKVSLYFNVLCYHDSQTQETAIYSVKICKLPFLFILVPTQHLCKNCPRCFKLGTLWYQRLKFAKHQG